MTESEWLNVAPPVMLNYLVEMGMISERKLRLFACACCRNVWNLLTKQVSREAVEAAELYADGKVSNRALHDVNRGAWVTAQFSRGSSTEAFIAAAYTSDVLVRPNTISYILNINGKTQRNLCLELCGPLPFRAFNISPSELNWNDAIILRLAQTIYDDHAFELMPILADALEEAGCDNQEMLRHCRQEGWVHVRGCWLIDLVLGKEYDNRG